MDDEATSFARAPIADDSATTFSLPPDQASDDSKTTFAPATAFGGGDSATTFTPLPSLGADDSATTFTPAPSGNPDDSATTFTPAPSGSLDDSATTFTPRPPVSGGPAKHASSGEDGPLKIGQHFGRYVIVRLLGAGGMGAVYQAWDEELEVVVALKVIRPEALSDPLAEQEIERRFKRELLLARQVTHKNVVRIHDLGEINRIKYITMSYVDGVDLATVVKREGKLSPAKALHVMRSVVEGLVAAHAAGVVHRDLKPANIMIDPEGNALIMDFGIARSTGGEQASAIPVPAGAPPDIVRAMMGRSAQTTMAGTIVGTVEYMAPEVARGLPADQRADVYAAGLILYDLLVGRRRADQAESAVAELRSRMEHTLAPIKLMVPEVPNALAAIISRAVENDPDKRYQTTVEFAAEIARLDENGEPLPIRRVVGLPMMAGAMTAVVAVLTTVWYFTRTPPPPKQHDPVTVVISDFQNTTNEAAFVHTLEPMLRRGLEDAGFISAYDRSRIRGTFGVAPPEKLDEAAARELALKQGVGVVLSGSIDPRGSGYEISLKATQTVTGNVVATAKGRASGKDQVIEAATRLVTTVRKALGDEKSDSAQLLAMKSLSTTSMEVAGHYAAAIEAQSNNKFDDAVQNFLKAVEVDPNFGLGYQGLALMSRNLGRLQEADGYTAEALKHLEGMTERERFAVRGSYYMTTGDFQQCVKEYGELITQYAADAVAHNNRALCMSKLREMKEAVDEMRQAVQILPKRVPFRGNLAIYATYAGDFKTAEDEAAALEEPTDLATLALAYAKLGQGDVQAATDTYNKLATIGARGKAWSVSGLGDLALYEGHYAEAARIFEQGAAADLAAKNPDRAARKLTALAYAQLLRNQKAPAIASAEKALSTSKAVPIRFLAARVFVEAGVFPRAEALAKDLSAELPAEPQAYGKIIEGEIALKKGDAREAVKILTDANTALDSWLAHYDLGRAYLELKAFPQADSEFERCIKRRGEALSLLVDEEATSGMFPTAYYYQGLVREGLKNAASAESYRAYLDIRGKSTEDPILVDVRKRVR